MVPATTRVVSIAVLDATLGQSRTEISCVDSISKQVQELIQALEKTLPEGNGDSEAQLVALAEVAMRIQRRDKSEKHQGSPK